MYVARRGQKEKEGRGGRGYILVIWREPVRESGRGIPCTLTECSV